MHSKIQMYISKTIVKLSPEELSALRSTLRHGEMKRIAEKLGYHRNTIAAVLAGKHDNDTIIEEVCRSIKNRHSEVLSIRKKIKEAKAA